MTDAAALTQAAANIASTVLAASENPAQAVMLCGMIAARIAANAEQSDPANGAKSLANALMQGFNAAMTLETSGRVTQPNRQPLGYTE